MIMNYGLGIDSTKKLNVSINAHTVLLIGNLWLLKKKYY